MKKLGLLALSAALLAAPAVADDMRGASGLALLAPVTVGGGAALIGTSTVVHPFVLTHTQVWNYPWVNKGLLGPNGMLTSPTGSIGQGINATGQYLSNVANPYYFAETHPVVTSGNPLLPGSNAHPKTGNWQTTAKYNERGQTSEQSTAKQGQFVVGCIMGVALGLIADSAHKGGGLKFIEPWVWERMTQAEKTPRPLTPDEVAIVAATCGLGAVYNIAMRSR